MKHLQVFNYEQNEVRTIVKDEQILWVAVDVCKILEFSNSSETLKRLDEDEVSRAEVIDSLGRKQETIVVNEPGLYNLILGSRKKEAKAFKRWIIHEVIPSIRRTGSYSILNARQIQEEKDFEIRLRKEQRLSEQVNISKAKELKDTAKTFMEVLDNAALQGIAYEVTRLLCGKAIIPQPMLESKYYTATEILKQFKDETGIEVFVQKFGRIATKYELRDNEKYGKTFLGKSQHSNRQVEHWQYSEEGREKAIEILYELYLPENKITKLATACQN